MKTSVSILNASVSMLLLASIVLEAACTHDSGVATAADASVADAMPGDGFSSDTDAMDTSALPYAQSVVSFSPGSGAGFGQEKLPTVVLGPPTGAGSGQASLKVLSLGVGGEIVLGFGERTLIDGEGPDLVVFENPFWVGGDPSMPFAELGEVSVSMDGSNWHTWKCDTEGIGTGRWPDCAGWTPTLSYDAFILQPIDPMQSGGDIFDLADLGLTEARFVRIRDLAISGTAPSAGFDLDAVGLIHWQSE